MSLGVGFSFTNARTSLLRGDLPDCAFSSQCAFSLTLTHTRAHDSRMHAPENVRLPQKKLFGTTQTAPPRDNPILTFCVRDSAESCWVRCNGLVLVPNEPCQMVPWKNAVNIASFHCSVLTRVCVLIPQKMLFWFFHQGETKLEAAQPCLARSCNPILRELVTETVVCMGTELVFGVPIFIVWLLACARFATRVS